MKFTLSLEGDFFEDSESLHAATRFLDYVQCLEDIREAVRSRRKYNQICEQEDKFLSDLSELIYKTLRD